MCLINVKDEEEEDDDYHSRPVRSTRRRERDYYSSPPRSRRGSYVGNRRPVQRRPPIYVDAAPVALPLYFSEVEQKTTIEAKPARSVARSSHHSVHDSAHHSVAHSRAPTVVSSHGGHGSVKGSQHGSNIVEVVEEPDSDGSGSSTAKPARSHVSKRSHATVRALPAPSVHSRAASGHSRAPSAHHHAPSHAPSAPSHVSSRHSRASSAHSQAIPVPPSVHSHAPKRAASTAKSRAATVVAEDSISNAGSRIGSKAGSVAESRASQASGFRYVEGAERLFDRRSTVTRSRYGD